MEGHPFYETARGLEYLFGFCYRDDTARSSTTRCGGETATASGRRSSGSSTGSSSGAGGTPGMHVYHYASYERSALTRLMGEHGTREQEVDDFLREEVLVDLYRVVKQALRASTDSYSIKAIEKLYGFERTAEVAGGDESVVRFEEWVETRRRRDPRRGRALQRGGLPLDVRAARVAALDPARRDFRGGSPPDGRERTEEAEERDEEREALKARLLDGAEEGEPRRLLAHLVDYHQREQRPAVVGVVPLAAARRRRARPRPHRDRRARVGREPARGRGAEATPTG